MAYPIRYNTITHSWESTGNAEKVLYVMTEQDPAEIQTMILSYLTGVNEEAFLYGTFTERQKERIKIAIEIMRKYKDNLLFARIPDPCAAVVKNLFRRYSLQTGVNYFFFDYIFSSPAMLNEYRDLKLPEYVCLRLFTTALKNLAIELNAFILTSTQISNDDGNGGFKDFHNIQGSKQVVNLADLGCIASRPTKEELKIAEGFKKKFPFSQTPNYIIDIFKNRRGKNTMCRIWSYMDLGTCRKEDLFITYADNNLMSEEDFELLNLNGKNEIYEDLAEQYNDRMLGIEEEVEEKIIGKKLDISVEQEIEATFGDPVSRLTGEEKLSDLI